MRDKDTFRLLFIGDIVGRAGRKAVIKILPSLRHQKKLDLVIANAENLAHGAGVTKKTLEEVKAAGIDFFTSGNHIFSKPEAKELLEEKDTVLIRPANFSLPFPGDGYRVLKFGQDKLLVLNLMGRVFIEEAVKLQNPFILAEEILEKNKKVDFLASIVDFHAEVTSEKIAFAHFLDGKVTAIFGTHTHVPTADLQLLAKGTAYVTDVGMVGLKDSVIGAAKEAVIKSFISDLPPGAQMHDQKPEGEVVFNAIFLEIDKKSKRVVKFGRLDKIVNI